jgi:hypothetical protein
MPVRVPFGRKSGLMRDLLVYLTGSLKYRNRPEKRFYLQKSAHSRHADEGFTLFALTIAGPYTKHTVRKRSARPIAADLVAI